MDNIENLKKRIKELEIENKNLRAEIAYHRLKTPRLNLNTVHPNPFGSRDTGSVSFDSLFESQNSDLFTPARPTHTLDSSFNFRFPGRG